MRDFDFKAARRQVTEILSIVEECPEPLKARCFELLFGVAFADLPKVNPQGKVPIPRSNVGLAANGSLQETGERELPGSVAVFARKYGVSSAQLHKLFLIDHDPILAVYKIKTKVKSRAQLQKVMMVLLENGLRNDRIKIAYPELRDAVRDAGLYDGNFNKTLKHNAGLFRGAITEAKILEGESVELTGKGMQRLADIVEDLAGSNV
ncbi:hypothetical protein V6C03_09530 [Methyloligella sp. 2.7D]|uniref:hypothetical protein n=1 Tax=unclassified Methyloligella TaxID=2625955 RepID=UPI00157D7EB3|nr:hypothetical protein [Methyloligella sp. GL2]QKP77910.1 hypothetical protein HT051_10925 [Methyloligella sp. GL2]